MITSYYCRFRFLDHLGSRFESSRVRYFTRRCVPFCEKKRKTAKCFVHKTRLCIRIYTHTLHTFVDDSFQLPSVPLEGDKTRRNTRGRAIRGELVRLENAIRGKSLWKNLGSSGTPFASLSCMRMYTQQVNTLAHPVIPSTSIPVCARRFSTVSFSTRAQNIIFENTNNSRDKKSDVTRLWIYARNIVRCIQCLPYRFIIFYS